MNKKIKSIKEADDQDNDLHFEHLSCGHVNNLKRSGSPGSPSGVCPQGDLDVIVSNTETLYFDDQVGKTRSEFKALQALSEVEK